MSISLSNTPRLLEGPEQAFKFRALSGSSEYIQPRQAELQCIICKKKHKPMNNKPIKQNSIEKTKKKKKDLLKKNKNLFCINKEQ